MRPDFFIMNTESSFKFKKKKQARKQHKYRDITDRKAEGLQHERHRKGPNNEARIVPPAKVGEDCRLENTT